MRHRRRVPACVAAALVGALSCAAPAAGPGQRTDLVHQSPEAWRALAAPGGSALAISIDRAAGTPALMARYRPESGRLAGVTRAVTGLAGAGLVVALETSHAASIVIGAVENDGSMYQALVQTSAGVPRRIGLGFEQLRLSSDSSDENGRLDRSAVTTLVIADPAGFLSTDRAERTLRLTSVAMVEPGDARLRPPDLAFTFDNGTEGWVALAAPIGSDVRVAVAREGAVSGLVIRYRPVKDRLAGVTRGVDGLSGTRIRARMRASATGPIVIGAVVSDGTMYQTTVQMSAAVWQDVDVALDALRPSGAAGATAPPLQAGDVQTLVVADPAGFLGAPAAEREVWIDAWSTTAGGAGTAPVDAAAAGYRPLVSLGPRSSSGARAGSGVTYVRGRRGQAGLVDGQGETIAVPVAGLSGREGTIEAWIAPQFEPGDARDFSAIFALHDEPFVERVASSLIVTYGAGGRISALANGQFDRALTTPPLSWSAGSWHHLAVSWGGRGLRIHWDGRQVAARAGPIDIGAHAALVVGNHAWTAVTHLPSRTAFDDLRVSSSQRTEAELAAAGGGTGMAADAATVALEHFDGSPALPIRLAGPGGGFHVVPPGASPRVRVAVPFAAAAGTPIEYEVSTPAGAVVRAGQFAAPAGAGEVVVALAGEYAPGFYRIRFAVRSGGALDEAGDDWFRVRREEPPRARSLLFGAAGHLLPDDPDRFFRLAAEAGVRSYRTAFEWSEIEPRDGEFVWDRYDRLVAAADRYGVELVPTLFWELPQPSWAGPGASRSGWTTSKHPPRDLAKWSDYVFHVVQRYRRSIGWWIPSNEPNLPQFWFPRPDAREYVAFLRATRDAARRADPQARIVGGSVAGIDLPFLREIVQAGALDVVDAIGLHAYIAPHAPEDRFPINNFDPRSERGTFEGGLSAVEQLVAGRGGVQRLWIDEIGQPYREDFVIPGWRTPEPDAAARLVKILVEAASRRVDRVMWFAFWGGEYGSFALLRPDASPSLPLVAYASLADRMAGAEFVRAGGRGEAVRSFTFRGPDGMFDVVWSLRGSTTVDVRAGDRIFDVYGTPVRSATPGRLTVDAAPAIILAPSGR
jgi:hypothetical protein